MQIDLDHYYKLISQNSELKKHLVTSCRGPWVYHGDSKKLDLQSGNSAFIYGFTDPDLIKARNSCNSYFVNNSDTETHNQISQLINNLERHTGMTAFAWAVSGSDAVEAAIAVNDQYWHTQGESKPTILTLDQCYHGTTYLLKSLRGSAPQFRHVTARAPSWIRVDDREEQETLCIESIYQHVSTNSSIGAVLLEAIPWIAGVLPFSNDFWTKVRSLCTQHDINLIIDDVAGCFGKLGHIVSHNSFQIEPDIVAIGKSLTGGYVPFGAALVCDRINQTVKDAKWDHTHTWCPVMDGIYLANVMIDKLERDLHKVPQIEQRFTDIMKKYGIHSKGQGLFQEVFSPTKEEDLYEHGLLVSIRSENSVKIVLPIIANDEYFEFLDIAISKLITL
jgi:adenosylmethionine-8-amino-7-oxononanoate aminotransferase